MFTIISRKIRGEGGYRVMKHTVASANRISDRPCYVIKVYLAFLFCLGSFSLLHFCLRNKKCTFPFFQKRFNLCTCLFSPTVTHICIRKSRVDRQFTKLLPNSEFLKPNYFICKKLQFAYISQDLLFGIIWGMDLNCREFEI